MSRTITSVVWVAATCFGMIGSSGLADDGIGGWCKTNDRWAVNNPPAEGGACPIEGSCDIPEIRDTWIPTLATPIQTLRMRFVVFAEDDGSNPAATQSDVDAQLVHFNEDILPSRFQFVAETAFVNSSQFLHFSIDETDAMKTTYAEAPESQVNVYVVQTSGFSFGTFPWDPNAPTALGGIVMHKGHFGPGQSILTHEMGHNLGLWHTHHGVSEVPSCSACYETADGVEGDTTGDFASDTPPTPVNFTCNPPGGTDGCSGTPWGQTDLADYMAYSPDACLDHFTDQQKGRWQCWFDDVLTGWLCYECAATGACCQESDPGAFSCTDVLANECDGSFFGAGTACDDVGAGEDRCDCNGNDVVDTQDIIDGTSDDCTANAIPDECEPDCNDNQAADSCDIADGVSDDCDGDGVPDECQPDEDCNANGIRDICDIGSGQAADCNGNDVPDECDINDATSDDCNDDDVPDECQPDCNDNQVADACDISDGTSADDDGNGVPDECQTVLYVAKIAAGANDGGSWDDAFVDLQDALTAVNVGDRIHVAQGIYTPTNVPLRIESFDLVGGVGVYGGYSGPGTAHPNLRDVETFETVLSGDLDGNDESSFTGNEENSFNVVTSIGHDASTILDGFTIRGGNADGNSLPFDAGGGMRVQAGSPTIRNCVFVGNSGVFGGGMENFDGGNPTVINTVFRGNRAAFRGGGMHNNGGAPTITRCAFVNNVAVNSGGGMRNMGSSVVVVTHSRFIGNTASFGGGMVNDDGTTHLADCLFSGNVADDTSGALHNWQSTVELVNCTFCGNVAGSAGGGILHIGDTSPLITNGVFWANSDQLGQGSSSQITLSGPIGFEDMSYTCVQGGVPTGTGAGNIATDPLFLDANGVDDVFGTEDDDARLYHASPGVNAGSPDAPPGSSDLDGHRRVLCDRVDMGAYESGAGDYDCDGHVDMSDFGEMVACVTGAGNDSFDPPCGAFDFDADDDVDFADFSGYQRRHAGTCDVTVIEQPASALTCLGQPVSFEAMAEEPGGANLSYQWRLNGVDVSGAVGSELSIASAAESDAGEYRCVVTAGCGELAFSGAAELVVTDAPTEFIAHPAGDDFCVGDVLFLSANATNLPTYHWFKDGVEIPDATGPFLIIASLSLDDAGTYHATATNGCNSATSDSAVIVVTGCGDGG